MYIIETLFLLIIEQGVLVDSRVKGLLKVRERAPFLYEENTFFVKVQ